MVKLRGDAGSFRRCSWHTGGIVRRPMVHLPAGRARFQVFPQVRVVEAVRVIESRTYYEDSADVSLLAWRKATLTSSNAMDIR